MCMYLTDTYLYVQGYFSLMTKQITDGIEITDFDELSTLLGGAYWIETKMEQVVEREAYIESSKKFKDIMFKLHHDSSGHKSQLEKLCSNLKGFNLDEATKDLRVKEFDFNGMVDDTIIAEMLKYDQLAVDIYTRLYKFTNKELIKEIWMGEDPEDYFKEFERLIKEELAHVALLKPHVERVRRIR